MQNPYVLAAVRKQQRLRSMRLPSGQAQTYPEGRAVADFFEGLGAGGPKASMMRNVLMNAAARQMTEVQLRATLAHLVAVREGEAKQYRELGAHPAIVENALRPTIADAALRREMKKRGLE